MLALCLRPKLEWYLCNISILQHEVETDILNFEQFLNAWSRDYMPPLMPW